MHNSKALAKIILKFTANKNFPDCGTIITVHISHLHKLSGYPSISNYHNSSGIS